MSFVFRQAKRENVPLLLGVAGGTGSGKTMSALRLARGLAGGHPFAGIDTENGRMSHYDEAFPELHVAQITAPFRPQKYADAIAAGVSFLEKSGVPLGNRVVIVDSASHEWAGDGGCLDWHDELSGGDPKKNLSAWIEPKREHKRMVTRLLQVNAHVILCFRAEPKVESVTENGRTKIVAKKGVTALDGWFPISEKMLPYELTASFLLMADRPGFPHPIKLQEQHKPFVPLDKQLGEETGVALARWAGGGSLNESGAAVAQAERLQDKQEVAEPHPASGPDSLTEVADDLTAQLTVALVELGAERTIPALAENRAKNPIGDHVEWLSHQLGRAREKLAARQDSESAVGSVAESSSADPSGDLERADSEYEPEDGSFFAARLAEVEARKAAKGAS